MKSDHPFTLAALFAALALPCFALAWSLQFLELRAPTVRADLAWPGPDGLRRRLEFIS